MPVIRMGGLSPGADFDVAGPRSPHPRAAAADPAQMDAPR